MAWHCSGATNRELVTNLFRSSLITSDRVKNALLNVDRAHFATIDPYDDTPQRIGYDATISAPHMHASAAEALLPFLTPGARVLDVGSGSGYLCAVFADLVSPGGIVVGVDHIPQLCALAETNLNKNPRYAQMLKDGGIKIVKADGRLGRPEDGPYDAIHVGAAAKGFPQALVEQLKAPGRMFVPVEEGFSQHIWVVDKDRDGKVEKKRTQSVMYVPLTDEKKFVD